MSKPLLSVCLITYNQARYVKEAMDSILAQQIDFSWELVVADDCSTDGTREILLEYKDKHPDLIKLILQKTNVGAEKNWHELMAYPKSKYVAYLEGDDYWTNPHKLQMQVDFLEKNPSYALCFHPTKVVFENGEETGAIWPSINDKNKFTLNELVKENFIPSNSVVYRRQDYSHIPSGIVPGDWYLHLYNAKFGKIGFISRAMSTYRRHSEGLWWNSHKDPDKLWSQYGIKYVALHVEILKLYGNDDKLREIIYKSMSDTLSRLIEVDNKYHKDLIKTAFKEFPSVDLAEILAVNQYKQLQEKSEYITKKDQEIEALNTDMLDLRAQVFRLRDELHALTNARLLGRIIKLRDYAGKARGKVMRLPGLPKATLHKIRVIFATFVPGPARRYIKRRLKELLRSPVQVKIYENKSWGSGPLVSVVIPYYNRADTIDETIDSLMAQTFSSFETIIVNDGSTEKESIDKFDTFEKLSLKPILIRQENKGVANARNSGINRAKGKYIICLDSDDALQPTFIEKCTMLLEANPDISLATTYMKTFGIMNEDYKHAAYDPLEILSNNMVITAAEFKKSAWKAVGGYKSGIGYEDWDFWLTLSEHGFWGRQIPEVLFRYRIAMQSRYVLDKDTHWANMKGIRKLHPGFKKNVRKFLAGRQREKNIVDPPTAFTNLDNEKDYKQLDSSKPNVLLIVPWLTFGGAETLILNFCKEIKDDYNLSFVTGYKAEHEWEHRFRELSEHIYHLPNLFEQESLYLEFISNYIKTRNINTIHIVHTDHAFHQLKELKKRHPKLKVIVTLFNDRAAHFAKAIEVKEYIDAFTSDNQAVDRHYRQELGNNADLRVIPNGINSNDIFNPILFDRQKERQALNIGGDDLAVFFMGRLSEEKNPDVFLRVARQVVKDNKNIHFFVVGDGHMKTIVEKMVAEINSKNVRYLGYQSDIARYLSAADIFVLPSSIEGFPLSILEAMAMKVAVVSSKVGAVPEIIDSGVDGFIVSPGSVKEISETILSLAKNRKLLVDVKTKSREKVENNYSNLILGENYKKLYRDITK